MHSYSIDSEERPTVYLILAILSILTTWVIKTKLNFPWWAEDPSIFGIFGLLYIFFDRHLWKWRVFKSIGLVKTPNYNGKWKGHIKSSFDEFKQEIEVELTILQHWTSIDISFETETSKGRSEIAGIKIGDLNYSELTYTYFNEPIVSADLNMNIHKGTSTLCFIKNNSHAKGDYYTGRGRNHYGEVFISKKE